MLLAHGGMHQKMYQAYEETTHVPLMIWYPKGITGPRSIDALTSHADLAPTLLGLAGLAPEQIGEIRQLLAVNHSDAAPLVGRDLSSLILSQSDFAGVNDPVYFMTDDDPTRGLHMNRRIGLGYTPVEQPAHIETVIACLNDGHLWKFSRYFDNPQYWSSPGLPGVDSDAEDLLRVQVEPDPPPDVVPQPVSVAFAVWAKGTPVPNEFEMYDLDIDPMEIRESLRRRRILVTAAAAGAAPRRAAPAESCSPPAAAACPARSAIGRRRASKRAEDEG